jgi:hypothetical protein
MPRKPKKPASSKRPNGHPSSFKPEYVEQAKKLCQLGATDLDLADFFHVAEKTIRNWQAAHPDFLEAVRLGKGKADERAVKRLYQRAVGYQARQLLEDWGKGLQRDEIIDALYAIPLNSTAPAGLGTTNGHG